MGQTNTIYLDCETRSEVDLKVCGDDVYARDPSTDCLCLAYAFNDEPISVWKMGEPCPMDIVIALHKNYRVVAHNVAFEWLIWKYVLEKKYGWPELKIENCDCTMIRAYAMALPGSLDNAAHAVGLEHVKDQKGARVMMQLSQPRGDIINGSGQKVGVTWYAPHDFRDKFEQLYEYC